MKAKIIEAQLQLLVPTTTKAGGLDLVELNMQNESDFGCKGQEERYSRRGVEGSQPKG